MERETILLLKQNLRGLLETIYVIQREFQLMSRHTSDDRQASDFTQTARNAESTAYSIDQLIGALNEDDEDLLRALKENPKQLTNLKNQAQSLERAVSNLQTGNSTFVNSIIQAVKNNS